MDILHVTNMGFFFKKGHPRLIFVIIRQIKPVHVSNYTMCLQMPMIPEV